MTRDRKTYQRNYRFAKDLGIPLSQLDEKLCEIAHDKELSYDRLLKLNRLTEQLNTIESTLASANHAEIKDLETLNEHIVRVLLEHTTQKAALTMISKPSKQSEAKTGSEVDSNSKKSEANTKKNRVNPRPIIGKHDLPPIPYQTDRIYLAHEQIPIPEYLEKYELSEHGVVTLTTIGYNNLTQDLKELWFIQLRNTIVDNHEIMCTANYKDYIHFSMDYDYDLHCEPKIYYMLWYGMDLGSGIIRKPPYVPKPECGSWKGWDPEKPVGV